MTLTAPRRTPHPHLLALGILAALAPAAAMAQSAADTDASDLDTVSVTGIRGSLQSSMNLKRDTVGVLDGIIAEDIGKFPDTNLAESMQRISGVSIDRTLSGEGSKVTVRGIGADFNQVLLNGRQMPAANLNDSRSGVSGARAFDFSNLASEAVSALEVYKTARADKPTGGIGATINVKTARPFNSPGLTASVGVKGVMDTSVDNLPDSYPGKSLTPEISGIFSNTFNLAGGGRFGVSANFSYQERDSAYSQARVNQGWEMFSGNENKPGRLPLPGEAGYEDITNRPGADTVYARPRNFMYLVSNTQRQRRNGQVTLQYSPIDTLTATLDYTYADNRVQQQRNELQVNFTHGPGASTWTDGPLSAPTIYTQDQGSSPRDLSLAGAQVFTRSELESVGFNLEWAATDALDFQFDYHNSTAELRPDNPLGSANFIVTLAPVIGSTTVDFSSDLPVLSIGLAPGINQLGPEHARMQNSGFRSAFNWSEVEQFQASGTFRFADYQAIDFGVAATEAFNRAASANTGSLGVPSNIGSADDFADDIWFVDNMGRYFKSFAGHNDPRLTDRFLGFDFDRMRDRAIELTGRPDWYTAPSQYAVDQRTTEKTRSAYLQWRNTYDIGMVPVSVSAGVRHERTEVDSPALVRPPSGNLIWNSDLELRVPLQDELVAGDFNGKYDYWLPSFDVRADLRDDLVLRGSYSKSIGRPDWISIQGGLSVQERYGVVTDGTGRRGNPGLLPVESKNYDISLEWYYGEGSYISAGYFRKDLKNFHGIANIRQSPYQITSPIGGRYWNDALAAGVNASDIEGIRNWIFANRADAPGVDVDNRTITGQQGDPVAVFGIQTTTNQRSDKLDGFEINLQHMFGDSGFGVSANYTKVDSGLSYNNLSLDPQFPMVGLSDSANLVVFFDKFDWQVRAAYNWRDEFLSSIGGTQGTVANPNYTESYGQLDVNVTWQVNENLAVFVEAINLTDETQRIYSRHQNMLFSASQTGPRYMFGARYKF